jgi:hypothetical protein
MVKQIQPTKEVSPEGEGVAPLELKLSKWISWITVTEEPLLLGLSYG